MLDFWTLESWSANALVVKFLRKVTQEWFYPPVKFHVEFEIISEQLFFEFMWHSEFVCCTFVEVLNASILTRIDSRLNFLRQRYVKLWHVVPDKKLVSCATFQVIAIDLEGKFFHFEGSRFLYLITNSHKHWNCICRQTFSQPFRDHGDKFLFKKIFFLNQTWFLKYAKQNKYVECLRLNRFLLLVRFQSCQLCPLFAQLWPQTPSHQICIWLAEVILQLPSCSRFLLSTYRSRLGGHGSTNIHANPSSKYHHSWTLKTLKFLWI